MLRRHVLIAGVTLVMGSIAVTALAQPGPGGRPGGPMMGGGGSSAMLLGMPAVQKELNLTDDQNTQVTKLLADVREQMRASMGQFNFQELQSLSADEREKRVADMRKKFEDANKGTDEKVAKILDADQAERLHQLQLQQQGAMALFRPEVIQKLHLSEDQQAKMKKIQEESRPKGMSFDPNQSAEERQAMFKKMQDQFAKAQKEILAVLTDDQMLDWTNMCGKEFKFPAPQFGRGNRAGGPPPAQR
jgi:hypothetical protein